MQTQTRSNKRVSFVYRLYFLNWKVIFSKKKNLTFAWRLTISRLIKPGEAKNDFSIIANKLSLDL